MDSLQPDDEGSENGERMTHQNKPDILPDNARMPSIAPHSTHSSRSDVSQESKSTASSISRRTSPGKTEKIETEESNKSTANEIIALLEQMQGSSNTIDPNHIPHGFCMRYMGRYTAI